MFNYNGKVALITGASSGIGKAYAEELASKRCHIGLSNYLMCNVGRFSTRKFLSAATEKYIRSSTPTIADARLLIRK